MFGLDPVEAASVGGSPRPYDVALFLCGDAIRELTHERWHGHPGHADAVYAWYLEKIAYLHHQDDSVEVMRAALRFRKASQEGGAQAGLWGGASREPLSCHAPRDEVDFSAAIRTVAPFTMGGDESTGPFGPALAGPGSYDEEGEEERDGSADVSCTPRLSFDLDNGAWVEEASPVGPLPTPCDSGFALILQLISLCDTVDPTGGALAAATALFRFITERLRCADLHDGRGHLLGGVSPARRAVGTAELDVFFAMDEATLGDSVMALGSATRSFHKLAAIAWSCAAFEQQAALAHIVTGWVAALEQLVRRPEKLQPLLAAACADSDANAGAAAAAVVNLTETYQLLRSVFEGHAGEAVGPSASAHGGSLLSRFLATAGPMHLADNHAARLLAMQDPGGPPAVARQELYNKGTQPILRSITTGMLLYVQLYLSLHSLQIAQRCADMAVLISHQLHSSEALALAHYGSFVVRLARGRPADAADSIAIALQLSVPSAGHGASAAAADAGIHVNTASLCFTGAAELLMLYPGAVGTSLRALLTSDHAASGGHLLSVNKEAATGGEGGGPDAGGSDAAATGGGGDAAGPPTGVTGQGPTAGGGGGHAVVVQSVAETVRNALWLSEAAAFLPDGSPAAPWTDVCGALGRETALTVCSIYGVQSRPRRLDTASLGAMLRAMNEGPAGAARRHHAASVDPRRVLLTEATRHTAHRALACVDERLPWDSAGADGAAAGLDLAAAFIAGVQRCYGPAGLAAVEGDAFFSVVLRYAALCRMLRRGYATAAFDGLTALVVRLYRTSGLSDCAAAASPAAGVTAAGFPGPGGGSSGAAGACAEPEAEEERVLRYLRASTPPSTAAPRPPSGAAACGGPAEGELFWPPDQLLLLASLQLRRAEAAARLGHITALATIAAALSAVSSRCNFAYGVLAAHLVGLAELHARTDFSGAAAAAAAAARSAAAVGLSGLEFLARAWQASALASAGHWVPALAQLDAVAGRVPPSFAAWHAALRLNAGYEALSGLPPSSPEDAAALAVATEQYVNGTLGALRAAGYLGAPPDGETATDLSLYDRLSLCATAARLMAPAAASAGGSVPEYVAEARHVAAVLRGRIHQRHVFTRVLDGALGELCAGMASLS